MALATLTRLSARAIVDAAVERWRSEGMMAARNLWHDTTPAQRAAIGRYLKSIMGAEWYAQMTADGGAKAVPSERLERFARVCCIGSLVRFPDMAEVERVARNLRMLVADKLPATCFEPHPHPWYNAYTMCKMLQEQVPHTSFYTASLFISKYFPMLYCPED